MVKVSVIIPVYNAEKYLNESINGILNQTLDDLEVLCVDDGSADNSLEILREFERKDNRVKVFHQENKGGGAARNLAIPHATGEYIYFMDADDEIKQNALKECYDIAEEKNVDFLIFQAINYAEDTKEYYESSDYSMEELADAVGEKVFSHEDIGELIFKMSVTPWCKFYNKDFVINSGAKFAEGLIFHDNIFFWDILLQAKRICFYRKILYIRRRHSASSTGAGDKRFFNTLIINNWITQIFIDNGVFDRYAHRLYNRKLNLVLQRYLNIQEQYKEEFFHKIKEDFSKMLDDERYDDFKSCLWPREKIFYNCVIDYDDFERFDLVLSNELLKYENNKYTKKNDILKEITGNVVSSNSWKVTKPLRAVGKIKRKMAKKESDPLVLKPKKGVRVLFIPSDNNRSSGAFLSMVNLIKELKARYGLDCFVIVPRDGNGYEVLDEYRIKYGLIESKDWVVPLDGEVDEKEIGEKKQFNKTAISRLSEFIRTNDVDLVHINTTYAYVAAEAALDAGVPFVWHLREFLEEDQNNTLWDRDEGNRLINRADKVIAISDSIYNKYSSVIDSDRLVRIYNGIDAFKFYKPNRNLFSKDGVRFVFVGGFEYYKGQIEFAKACVALYENGFTNFDISFVGKGKRDVRAEVRRIFKDAGMTNYRMLGYREDVENYYAKADISFTCSKSEAFGRTTVEAMLSGNLVIGADSAGTRELIRDGETGMLYEQGNIVDLASKMSYAVNNIEESKRIARNGAYYMYDNMTSQINADNVYALYKEILGL